VTATQPAVVTLRRPRHPFDGRGLPVLGSMRRHGAAELLVVLPDGSKRLIPAAWTDLQPRPGNGDGAAAGTLGTVADLLDVSALISGLCARVAEQAARKPPCKEDNRAACPAQSAAGPGSGATTSPDRAPAGSASPGSADAAGPPDRQGRRDGRAVGRQR
jgi:Family of unknown function (DUF5372)